MKSLLAALFALPLSLAAAQNPPAPAPTPGPGPTTPAAPVATAAPVIAPGPNFVADGLPAIPASIAAEARRYTEFRGVGTAAWHPQRRELLISTRFGSTNQLHVVKTPGADRTQITFFDEPVTGGSYDPSGKFIVFGRDTGGNEYTQLYRLDLADNKVTRLTDGGRSRNLGVQWSANGARIAYTSTRRNGNDRDVYVMNPADPATDRMVLQVNSPAWTVSGWSPDGTQLLVVESLSDVRSVVWLVDVATGQRASLTPASADTVSYSAAQFAADGRGVFLVTDRTSEYRQLFYFDLSANAFTPLTTDIPWNVDRFRLSPDGKRLAFEVNEAGASRIYLLETASRAHRLVSGLPNGVVGTIAWSSNSREVAVTVSSAQSAADAYSIDAESGQVTRWTESELGGLSAADLAEPIVIRYRSFDNVEVTALYHKPPARFTGPRPVIINIRDEGQSRPVFMGRANYFLNELGIAIISPNVRGSTGYGRTFVRLDNGTRREDAVRDIGALLDWIARQPDHFDPSKVLVAGGGGYMTVAVVTGYNDRIAGAMTLGVAAAEPAAAATDTTAANPAADLTATSSMINLLQNPSSFRPETRRLGSTGSVDSLRAFLTGSALATPEPPPADTARAKAAKVAKPLFVVQGGNDPRIPLSAAQQMVLRIRQNGSPVWYLLGRDEGHRFRKKANIDFQFYAAVAFVRQYLLGEDLVQGT